MMHVQDLKLETDVLPFFDFTNNEQSAARLTALLNTPPATEAEVLERQAVTKGMLANWVVLEGFTYRRLDLREVYTHFEGISSRSSVIESGIWMPAFRLLLDEAERNRLRARAVQIVLLLHDIQKRYLAQLDASKFPGSFQKELLNAFTFLNRLRLEAHARLIKEGRFTIPRIIGFTQLLQDLGQGEANRFWEFFFSFEAYWSIAKGMLAHGFSFPTFNSDFFRLEAFYHPVLQHPVKNTLELDADQNVLLLTGPNMSGKSTLLKAVAICVYLTHTGFPVPAAACSVPFFHSIAIAINLNDNLRDGYSHFMTEIAHLKAVVQATTGNRKCFAVFDEIFRGTNVDDALDITRTTVSGLTRFQGSFFLISTHMLQLEEHLENGSRERIRKCYIECRLEDGLPRFSYTLRDGWSQLRIGRILFEKEGLGTLLSAQPTAIPAGLKPS
ncbi:MutS-related protein [Pontibacter roseus]|uniref:MutS-related protein n=1 Tax=Pontibacter roseus TaxID=336989 RepID=UPI000376541A|nr:hypothetical protein [Pontibacter roseus]